MQEFYDLFSNIYSFWVYEFEKLRCDASLSYKADWWEVSLVGRNLAGISCYERIRVSSTLQSYTLTHLRPREVLVKVCLDL